MWSKLIAPYLLFHLAAAPSQRVAPHAAAFIFLVIHLRVHNQQHSWNMVTTKLLLVGSAWIKPVLNCASLNTQECPVPVVSELQATE